MWGVGVGAPPPSRANRIGAIIERSPVFTTQTLLNNYSMELKSEINVLFGARFGIFNIMDSVSSWVGRQSDT